MDSKKIDELLEQADNRFSIANRYDEWRAVDKNQADKKLEGLAKSYGKDEFFEEYIIDRVKQLNYLSDRELMVEAEAFSSICKSEVATGKSVCYAKNYAETKLWSAFVDKYCRVVAEVYDYADKQGVKEDPFLFASDCAEVYVNEHITDLLHLKDIYKADWQQEFILKLRDRMIKELESENENARELDIPSALRKSHTDEIMDMMFPEGIDDGVTLAEEE